MRGKKSAIIIGVVAAAAAAVILIVLLINRDNIPKEAVTAEPVHIYVHFQDPGRLAALESELSSFQKIEPDIIYLLHQLSFSELDSGFRNGTLDPAPDLLVLASPGGYGDNTFLEPPVPWIARSWVLYYSRKALSAIGIEPEKERNDISGKLAEGTLDIDQWNGLLQELHSAAIVPITVGARYGWPLALWIQHLTAYMGNPDDAAALTNPQSGEIPESFDMALGQFEQYIMQGWVWDRFADSDWPAALRPLISGEAAFCLLSDNLITSVPPDYRNDIGFLPFPGSAGKEEEQWLIGSVVYLGIPADSVSPESSRRILGYLTSPGTTGRLSRKLLLPMISDEDQTGLVMIPGLNSSSDSRLISAIMNRLVPGE